VSAFWLRALALTSMLIDHVGLVLLRGAPSMRGAGRLAFPLYCFLLAEGFIHTRDAKRYGLRLAIFAILSEIPFDLAFANRLWDPSSQNVFLTLLLALVAMACCARLKSGARLPAPVAIPAALLCVAGLCALSVALKTDYVLFGVLFPLGFYIFRQSKRRQIGCFLLLLGGYLLYMRSRGISQRWVYTQALAALAVIPIALYNGKPGPRILRWLFYAAYPLHLLALWAARHGQATLTRLFG
jgi:hypothetical protein